MEVVKTDLKPDTATMATNPASGKGRIIACTPRLYPDIQDSFECQKA